MKKQGGFTIIEFLVAITVGLIILTGVTQVMMNSRSQQMLSDEMSTMQENARFALDVIARDIRMAGYRGGCDNSGNVSNSVNDPGATASGFGTTGIKGWQAPTEPGYPTTAYPIAPDYVVGTDVVLMEKSEPLDDLTVTGHNPVSAVIQLGGSTTAVQKGDILMIASPNCDQVSIFAMSGPTSNSKNNIVHNTGGGLSPDNCSKFLGGNNKTCASGGLTSYTFGAGASIMRLKSVGYYLKRDPASNLRTLYRADSKILTDMQVLVANVEDLQFSYGVDTDIPASATAYDGTPNRYLDAPDVQAIAADVYGKTGWDRVNSVRVTLVLRSMTDVLNTPRTEVLSINGVNKNYPDPLNSVPPGITQDRKARMVVSQVIQLRNRTAN